MKYINFYLIFTALTLHGCASQKAANELAAEQAKASKIQLKADNQRQNIAQEKAQNTLEQFPSWALQVPAPDATGVYAIGIGDSDKVPIAIKKAQLEAEYGLAKLYNQELAGSERSSQQDNGNGSSSQYTALISKLVDYVPVVGFQIIKQDIKAIDGKFNAFILMKLPYEEFNKVLQQQKQKAQGAQDKAVFDDLEKRLELRRKAKAQQI
jgi:hypothetical protein